MTLGTAAANQITIAMQTLVNVIDVFWLPPKDAIMHSANQSPNTFLLSLG
jgi:hypothetical protein